MKELFEILIYRIKKDKFYQQYEKYRDNNIKEFEKINEVTDELIKKHDHLLRKLFGCPWNYNQIVGAIKIVKNNSSLDGEFWLSTKGKFQRKMTYKDIDLRNIASFHININFLDNVEELKSSIIKDVKETIKNTKKNLYPDFSCFNNIINYIDFQKLKNENN